MSVAPAAIHVRIDYLINGDRDLLDTNNTLLRQRVSVVSPRDFYEQHLRENA